MLYCKRHDLTFCSQHVGMCLGENCVLAESEDAQWCSVCCGVILPRELDRSLAAPIGMPPDAIGGGVPAGLPDCPFELTVSRSIVVDWRDSWPQGVDGVFIVCGVTVDEFKALQAAHPELSSIDIIAVLKSSGHSVDYIPGPKVV